MIRQQLVRSRPVFDNCLQKRTFIFRRKKPRNRFVSSTLTFAGVLFGATLIVYAADSKSGIHKWLVVPAIHAYTKDDAEKAHQLAIAALKSGFAPKDRSVDDPALSFELWGRQFKNPIGIAAGVDKHGEVIDPLFDLGFGYVEIGSVTPEAQEGNPKPRVFRIPSTESVINRYGFNSDGHLLVLARLRNRIMNFFQSSPSLLPSTIFPVQEAGATVDPYPIARLLSSPIGNDANLADLIHIPRSLRHGQLLAINLGKNKVSPPDAIDDFVHGVQRLGPFADVLVVNVSSPNTPGLRSLQQAGMIDELLSEVVKARNNLSSPVKPPVLVKIAPDLSEVQLDDIAQAALESKIDGIIVSNTTISRPSAAGTELELKEAGGLSGPPLKSITLPLLQALYRNTRGQIPIIGCGGITTGQDVIDYAKAGASFVQLYTSFTYQGVGLPRHLKDEVTTILHKEHKTWKQIIGSAVDVPAEDILKEERKARAEKAEEQSHQVYLSQLEDAREELRQTMQLIEKEEEASALKLHALPVLIEEPSNEAKAVSTQASSVQTDADLPLSGVVKSQEKSETEIKELVRETRAAETGNAQGRKGLGGLLSTWGARANAPQTGKKLV